MSLPGWALIQYDWCTYKTRKFGWNRDRHAQRRDKARNQPSTSHEERPALIALEGNQLYQHLILAIWIPELWDNTHLLLKTGSFWDFVTAALTDITGYQNNWVLKFLASCKFNFLSEYSNYSFVWKSRSCLWELQMIHSLIVLLLFKPRSNVL